MHGVLNEINYINHRRFANFDIKMTVYKNVDFCDLSNPKLIKIMLK